MERRKIRKARNWFVGTVLVFMVYFAAAPWIGAWYSKVQLERVLPARKNPGWADRSMVVVMEPSMYCAYQVRPYYQYTRFCYKAVIPLAYPLPDWEDFREARDAR